jgi:multicomponent Na+:H+ antiporter subunit D
MGPQLGRYKDVKEVPKSMLIGMGIITCIIVIFGLFPEYILSNIVEPAANALVNYQSYITHVVGGGI